MPSFMLARIALALAERLGPWTTLTGPSRFVAERALAVAAWQALLRARLAHSATRLAGLLARHGPRRAARTPLFGGCPHPRAAAIQARLAKCAILAHRYGRPAGLRFGLPGLLLLATTAAATAAVSVVDDRGDELMLAAPAARIVSLAPHATELLFAAGAGAKVVGAVSYSDYPPEAKAIPRVGGYGDYTSVDFEAVLALRPDLVVAWQSGNGERVIERLRALGLRVFVTEPRRLDDIPRALDRLGRLAGSYAQAHRAAERFRRRHAALTERNKGARPVRVFYQVWNQPLMTVSGEQLISQVMSLCGGRNVFADLPALAAAVDLESVLARDPEAIVASGRDARRPSWLDDWKRWPSLTAVRQDNLFFVPPDLIQRHSPRVLDGAELLCRHLQQARERP